MDLPDTALHSALAHDSMSRFNSHECCVEFLNIGFSYLNVKCNAVPYLSYLPCGPVTYCLLVLYGL